VKAFTALYLALSDTTRTSEKLQILRRYFQATPPIDAAWAVYVLSGRKIGRSVSWRLLRDCTAEVSGYPPWLIDQCFLTVGDLSETLALLLPSTPEQENPPALHEMIEQYIQPLALITQKSQRELILSAWPRLNADEKLVFHKLLGGEFRVGVSKALLIRALAEVAGIDAAIIAHRLAGSWRPDASAMARLLGAHDPSSAADPGVPYPFMLAHPLSAPLATLGAITDWLIEWKWDGIRAQLIRRSGKAMLWSRGDEMVSQTFPEIVQAAATLPEGTVLDGEIVAWDDNAHRPLPFTKLQRRLNRQSVEPTFWPEIPVMFIAFDVLELDGQDVRNRTLAERRESLASLLQRPGSHPMLQLSTPVAGDSWEQIEALVAESRTRAVEGVMLKRTDSIYVPGRPTGLWWKKKIEPYTVDVVMIAAEPGHGRRAGLLTDYTFGVWDNDALVPVAKAYSGLTDEEIAEVDRFVRGHTLSRHGPVHVVQPKLVFELGFEAIQRSTRHKSGIALRFPRMLRMRKEKKPADADRLETLLAMVGS